MTRTFDLIHEEPLRSDDFGEGEDSETSTDFVSKLILVDKLVNVGWGSKSTQFHGSLGKSAARIGDPSSSSRPASLSHPTDDGLPTITFRGDAAFFAVSSLDPYPDSSLRKEADPDIFPSLRIGAKAFRYFRGIAWTGGSSQHGGQVEI